MSKKEDLDSIHDLILEAKEIKVLSLKFFLSVPIESKKHFISTGNHIPSFDGDINKNPTICYTYNTWGILSKEMILLQQEIFHKYELWYEHSKPLIEKYNPHYGRNLFATYNKLIIDCINLSDQSISINNEEMYQRFMNLFESQKRVLDSIPDIIESQYIYFLNKNKLKQGFRVSSNIAKKQWQLIIALLSIIVLLAGAINGWSVITEFINTTFT